MEHLDLSSNRMGRHSTPPIRDMLRLASHLQVRIDERLSQKHKCFFIGFEPGVTPNIAGVAGVRTSDLDLQKRMLYQLHYAPPSQGLATRKQVFWTANLYLTPWV